MHLSIFSYVDLAPVYLFFGVMSISFFPFLIGLCPFHFKIHILIQIFGIVFHQMTLHSFSSFLKFGELFSRLFGLVITFLFCEFSKYCQLRTIYLEQK